MADAFVPVRGMLIRTVVVSGLACLVALAIGFYLYRPKDTQAQRDEFSVPVLYPLLEHKYYIDDFYMDGIVRPIRGPVARAVDWFNGHVIDLVINGTGWVVMRIARFTYWFDQRGVDAGGDDK